MTFPLEKAELKEDGDLAGCLWVIQPHENKEIQSWGLASGWIDPDVTSSGGREARVYHAGRVFLLWSGEGP